MRQFAGIAGFVIASVLSVAAVSNGAAAADAKYVVGVSNTLIGNGWREEMICSIKAQALASGIVSKVVVANRNGGPSEQIADLRNLISAGANVIVLNPSDRSALDPVIKQAAEKGIVVVAVDQAVTAPEAYVLTNDQVAYGKLGAEWLFKKLGGKGDVVEMRGIDGVPADADRHEGFQAALKEFPDIKVTSSVFTGWALNKAAEQAKDLIASGKKIDGIWTSGLDSVVVDAYRTAKVKYRSGCRRRQQRLHRRSDEPQGRRTDRRRRDQPADGRRCRLGGRTRRFAEEGSSARHPHQPGSVGRRQHG